MSGNATYRSTNTAVLAVSAVDAPVVVTSDEIDERLRPTYERVGLQPGMLERLAGIQERRWWPEGVSFADGAADRRGQGAGRGRRRRLAGSA